LLIRPIGSLKMSKTLGSNLNDKQFSNWEF